MAREYLSVRSIPKFSGNEGVSKSGASMFFELDCKKMHVQQISSGIKTGNLRISVKRREIAKKERKQPLELLRGSYGSEAEYEE